MRLDESGEERKTQIEAGGPKVYIDVGQGNPGEELSLLEAGCKAQSVGVGGGVCMMGQRTGMLLDADVGGRLKSRPRGGPAPPRAKGGKRSHLPYLVMRARARGV